MAKLDNQGFDAATQLGRRLLETEPHAKSAKYDRKSGRLILELTNECTFAVPVHFLQGLENATPAQIEALEISGDGYGLHWNELDTDLSVSGLLAGIFGTKAHMSRLTEQGVLTVDPTSKTHAA
jgi:hypothetical protein